MNSGVKVCSSCDEDIGNLEKRKLEYVIFKLVDMEGSTATKYKKVAQKIVVLSTSPFGEDSTTPAAWARFSEKIQEEPVAFGCCYFTYQTLDGRSEEKLPFVHWSNEKATVSEKMIASSSKKSIQRRIKSCGPAIQADNKDELKYEEVMDTVKKLK